MAMLLDGPPSTIEDLNARDSDLANVSVSENINLTAKLQLAARDIEMAVESMLLSVPPNYGRIRFACPSLRNIAVTPQLKRWHTYMTLRLVYQDLYYSRLNDRYQAKMKLYSDEESRMADESRTTGLGVVFDPLPQALAPQVATIATSDSGGTIYVGVTFVNERGEQGLMSTPIEVDTQDGTAASFSLIGLADNAVGWNLYAGLSPDALARQNNQTLDPMSSVVLAPGRLASGPKPGFGQRSNTLFPVPRRILRG
jgi:hypothetical protein